MCSSVRATVSRASRSSVESRATPSSRHALPSVPGSTRPCASIQRTDPSRCRTRYSAAYSPHVSIARCTASSVAGTSSSTSVDQKVAIRPSKVAGSMPNRSQICSSHTRWSARTSQSKVPTAAAVMMRSSGTRPWAAGSPGRPAAPQRRTGSDTATPPPRPRPRKSDTLAGMSQHPRAGQPAQPSDLVDVAALVTAYYTEQPDPSVAEQQVTFGTSGHRGSSLDRAFNEGHILATTQAICEHRAAAGVAGPLFLGRDTHGLSEPAWSTALEVFAANEVTVLVDDRGRWTPTPAVSHAVLRHNREATGAARADGVVV